MATLKTSIEWIKKGKEMAPSEGNEKECSEVSVSGVKKSEVRERRDLREYPRLF